MEQFWRNFEKPLPKGYFVQETPSVEEGAEYLFEEQVYHSVTVELCPFYLEGEEFVFERVENGESQGEVLISGSTPLNLENLYHKSKKYAGMRLLRGIELRLVRLEEEGEVLGPCIFTKKFNFPSSASIRLFINALERRAFTSNIPGSQNTYPCFPLGGIYDTVGGLSGCMPLFVMLSLEGGQTKLNIKPLDYWRSIHPNFPEICVFRHHKIAFVDLPPQEYLTTLWEDIQGGAVHLPLDAIFPGGAESGEHVLISESAVRIPSNPSRIKLTLRKAKLV